MLLRRKKKDIYFIFERIVASLVNIVSKVGYGRWTDRPADNFELSQS